MGILGILTDKHQLMWLEMPHTAASMRTDKGWQVCLVEYRPKPERYLILPSHDFIIQNI